MDNEETLFNLAYRAETLQHWCMAAILWRRVGQLADAVSCEEICQYLAEANMDKLSYGQHGQQTKKEKKEEARGESSRY